MVLVQNLNVSLLNLWPICDLLCDDLNAYANEKEVSQPSVERNKMELGKRKCERRAFSQIIVYSIPTYIDDKVSTGLVRNFSHSGFCMVTLSPLQDGQEIRIKSSQMSNSTAAIVRWCSDLGNSTYKVGLEFKN